MKLVKIWKVFNNISRIATSIVNISSYHTLCLTAKWCSKKKLVHSMMMLKVYVI